MQKGLILFILLTLVLEAGAQSSEQTSIVQQIKQEYEAGDVASAEFLALKALKKKEGFSPEELLDIHKYLAFCYIALGERESAVEEFMEVLEINPKYRFPRQLTSPKIMGIFEEALQNFKQLQELKKEPPPEATSHFKIEASKKSLIFPGRGQLYKGQTQKGYLFIGAEALSITALAVFQWQYQKAHDDYRNAVSPDDIKDKYKIYNNFYKLRNFSAAAAAAIYIYSYIDCLYTNPVSEDKLLTLKIEPQRLTVTIDF